jgi:SRSO17 transposase
LEQAHQRYLTEIPANTVVWATRPLDGQPADGFVRQVRHPVESLPARAWEIIKLREGAKGPLAFEFARHRVWSVRHRHAGPPLWLLVRRSFERVPEIKFNLSNAAPDMPLQTMALVTRVRWRVEEFFEEAKGQLGMAHYEARSWTSWHHHMSLVALAHLYVTQTERELKRKVPELTLEMAMRLLRSAPPRPQLSLEDAQPDSLRFRLLLPISLIDPRGQWKSYSGVSGKFQPRIPPCSPPGCILS